MIQYFTKAAGGPILGIMAAGMIVAGGSGFLGGISWQKGQEAQADIKDGEKAETIADTASDVAADRTIKIEDGKSTQRAEDGVTRAAYDALALEKANDRTEFNRRLRAALDANSCAPVDMPFGLQRRSDKNADRFGGQADGDNPGADTSGLAGDPVLPGGR